MRYWPLLLILLFLAYRQYGDRLPELTEMARLIQSPAEVSPAPAVSNNTDGPPFVPNYLKNPQMQATRRWRSLPVRVYFEANGAYTADRRDAALSGFSTWEKATGGVLRYAVVDSASKAEVTVRFIPGAYVPPNRSTVGLTRSLSSEKWLRSAQMTLATGGQTTLENLADVAAHEWGHALGINGHSDDPKDLMTGTSIRVITISPFGRVLGSQSKVQRPTQRDLNTVKTIYADRFNRRETRR